MQTVQFLPLENIKCLFFPRFQRSFHFQATGLLSRIIRNSALSGHPLWTVKSGFITGYWLWFRLSFHLHFLCGTYSLWWVKFYHAVVLCPINVYAFLLGGRVHGFVRAGVSVSLCTYVSWRPWDNFRTHSSSGLTPFVFWDPLSLRCGVAHVG